jgi:hypothetical protein
MQLVSSWPQVRQNLATLHSYRVSPHGDEREFYRSLIRLGKCFVLLQTKTGLLIGPSRFAGYVANDRVKHLANHTKHGWHTNHAIEQVIGLYQETPELEQTYLRFCAANNIPPAGYRRRYWFRAEPL